MGLKGSRRKELGLQSLGDQDVVSGCSPGPNIGGYPPFQPLRAVSTRTGPAEASDDIVLKKISDDVGLGKSCG